MRSLAGLLVLALALSSGYAGAHRGQAEPADAADAGGAAGGLQILFPRAGQTLCHEDELELLALYDGSPLVPAGGVAVLEIDGRVASELHSGALAARLPGLRGAFAKPLPRLRRRSLSARLRICAGLPRLAHFVLHAFVRAACRRADPARAVISPQEPTPRPWR